MAFKKGQAVAFTVGKGKVAAIVVSPPAEGSDKYVLKTLGGNEVTRREKSISAR